MDNKKESQYLFLGYLSYLTIFLVPLFLFLTKSKTTSERLKEHIAFIKKTTTINLTLLVVFVSFFTFLGYVSLGKLGGVLEIGLFTTFLTIYFFNFIRGLTYILCNETDLQL